jgi:hypothetical protein
VGQFEDYWERALMDYDGNLDVAEPIVEVSLWDPTWYRENKGPHFAWDLLKNERKRWKSREEEYSYKITCRNEKFKAVPIKVNLDKTDKIQLKVNKT